MNIRPATVDDCEGIVDLASEFFQDRLEDIGMHFDRNVSVEQFRTFIGLANIKHLVAEDNGKIIGIIAGFIGPKLFASGNTMQEIVWFVSKNHRRCGLTLLKKFENISKECGCCDIMMVGLNGDPSCDFYEKFGYKLTQKTFTKEF